MNVAMVLYDLNGSVNCNDDFWNSSYSYEDRVDHL